MSAFVTSDSIFNRCLTRYADTDALLASGPSAFITITEDVAKALSANLTNIFESKSAKPDAVQVGLEILQFSRRCLLAEYRGGSATLPELKKLLHMAPLTVACAAERLGAFFDAILYAEEYLTELTEKQMSAKGRRRSSSVLLFGDEEESAMAYDILTRALVALEEVGSYQLRLISLHAFLAGPNTLDVSAFLTFCPLLLSSRMPYVVYHREKRTS